MEPMWHATTATAAVEYYETMCSYEVARNQCYDDYRRLLSNVRQLQRWHRHADPMDQSLVATAAWTFCWWRLWWINSNPWQIALRSVWYIESKLLSWCYTPVEPAGQHRRPPQRFSTMETRIPPSWKEIHRRSCPPTPDFATWASNDCRRETLDG